MAECFDPTCPFCVARRRDAKATPPEAPPNRVVGTPSMFSLCFWLGHLLRWETRGRSYVQEVCIRCGHTGATNRKPPAPPAPPPWQNINEEVKGS
jgi:hypothetical protein